MEVEWDIESYGVSDDGSDEVSQDQTCTWVMQDELQGHDWEVDDRFGVDEERKSDAEYHEGGNDEGVGPREDVPAEILFLLAK